VLLEIPNSRSLGDANGIARPRSQAQAHRREQNLLRPVIVEELLTRSQSAGDLGFDR